MPVLGEGLFGFSQFVTRLSYPIIIMLVSFLSLNSRTFRPREGPFPFWAADSKDDAPAATAEPFSARLKMKAKPLEATLLPLAFDPGCSDHDSPADGREAQAHEEETENLAYRAAPARKRAGQILRLPSLSPFQKSVSRSLWDLNSSRLYISSQKTFNS